jgi:hypothetical protein
MSYTKILTISALLCASYDDNPSAGRVGKNAMISIRHLVPELLQLLVLVLANILI